MATSGWGKPLFRLALFTLVVLLVPLVAMQFTREVSWGAEDFLAAGVLIFTAGCAVISVLRRFRRPSHRMAGVAVVALVFLLTWAELAVGIFR